MRCRGKLLYLARRYGRFSDARGLAKRSSGVDRRMTKLEPMDSTEEFRSRL